METTFARPPSTFFRITNLVQVKNPQIDILRISEIGVIFSVRFSSFFIHQSLLQILHFLSIQYLGTSIATQ